MQHTAVCNGCVVTFLLRESPGPVQLDAAETEALSAMADVGLLPQLRLLSPDDPLAEAVG